MVRWTLALGLIAAISFPLAAAEPQPLPKSVTTTTPTRVVAYIHGNVPITREELADYLIARGGETKLELLTNKRIIEAEAARAGVSVTRQEIEATLNEEPQDVVMMILKQSGKSLLEWREDVIRPRLLLGKMVRETIKFTEDEIQKAHEAQYGEKRQARVIVWPKETTQRPSDSVVGSIRASDAEFDRIACNQPDSRLAQSRGGIAPVGLHSNAKDPTAVNVLFNLKVDEISELFETKDGWMLMRCTAIIPPDPVHALDKPAMRAKIEREVVDQKLGEAIPKLFDSLKSQYKANVIACNPTEVKPASYTVPTPVLPQGTPDQVLVTLTGPDGPKTVTRADLGEYLIMHKGAEALELLVNRRIIQAEAAKRNITFTQEEVDAAFDAMVAAAGPNITKEVFVEKVLPMRRLSLYQYIEDVVKPDLVLSKMVRDRVKVSEDDLKKAFERKYGEKRACEIILWPKGEEKAALGDWTAVREQKKTFEQTAKMQADPNLAAAAGKIAPVSRHLEGLDNVIEKVAFELRVGEMSHLLQTKAGTMCIRTTGIIPPTAGVKLEEVRAQLEREELDKFVTREIPVFVGELKKAAAPTMLLQRGGNGINFEQVRQDAEQVQKK